MVCDICKKEKETKKLYIDYWQWEEYFCDICEDCYNKIFNSSQKEKCLKKQNYISNDCD